MNAVVVQHPNSTSFRALPRIATEVRRLQADALWITLNEDSATGLQNFTPDLVREFHGLVDDLQCGRFGVAPLHYAVVQSAHPEYFSMGGDLRFFRDCIQRRDAVPHTRQRGGHMHRGGRLARPAFFVPDDDNMGHETLLQLPVVAGQYAQNAGLESRSILRMPVGIRLISAA